MKTLNKALLIGNLTRDPELKTTPQGQAICTFGIATNRDWTTQDGRHQQSTEFHDIACWGGLADHAHKTLRKGKLVYVTGYIKSRSWDDAQGLRRFRTEIVAEDLIILSKREDSAGSEDFSAEASLDERIHGEIDLTNASATTAAPSIQMN